MSYASSLTAFDTENLACHVRLLLYVNAVVGQQVMKHDNG